MVVGLVKAKLLANCPEKWLPGIVVYY
jgi:hypothetical protein